MTHLAIGALLAAPALSGCALELETETRRQASGLDWGDGDEPEVVESDLPDPTVTFLDEFTIPAMRGPYGIAVGADGIIGVADTGAQLAHLFDPECGWLTTLPAPGAMGIAIDDDGRIYVGDRYGGSVRIFDSGGAPAGFLGGGAGALHRPSDIAWDPTAGWLWVTDPGGSLVRAYAADTGIEQLSFGSFGTGAGQFHNPTGIAVDDADGLVYVTDNGNARIQVFDRTGAYLFELGSYGSGKGQFNRPGGLAIDALDRIYVTDAFQSTLQVVDTDGLHVSYLGEAGDMYGQIHLSADVVLDPFNRLLVTSYRTSKFLVYGIDDWTEPSHAHPPLAADVAVEPGTLTALARAPWVTAYVEVIGCDVYDLDAESVRLQELSPAAGAPATIGDRDDNGVPDLALKFGYADLIAALGGPGVHTVTLTGELDDGATIEGTAEVSVLDITVGAPAKGDPPAGGGAP